MLLTILTCSPMVMHPARCWRRLDRAWATMFHHVHDLSFNPKAMSILNPGSSQRTALQSDEDASTWGSMRLAMTSIRFLDNRQPHIPHKKSMQCQIAIWYLSTGKKRYLDIFHIKADNILAMQAEGLKKDHLDKYKSKRRSHHMYRAASRLWAAGLPWEQAFTIVKESFDAVIADS